MTEHRPRLFCSKPFDYLEPGVDGETFLCCPSWLPRSIGNAGKQDPGTLWNGARAREIRASILDGSFRYCSEQCPHLGPVDGPVQPVDEVSDPEHRRLIEAGETRVPRGPKTLICSYDRSCNLACPTCRTDILQATKSERARLLVMQERLFQAFAGDLETVYVTGSGDPFGSPLFHDLLRGLDPVRSPDLRLHLHTNAQLFTRARWAELPNVHTMLDFVEVSIDASTPETYHVNRAPGKWDRLLENLEFLSELRRGGFPSTLTFSFVVQANNWREMPEFVELGERFGADGVYFGELVRWWFPRRVLGLPLSKVPVLGAADFENRAVHLPEHPDHEEFVESLSDPVFDRPGVGFGTIGSLRRSTATR